MKEHQISVVVPVYKGEFTLDDLVSEIIPLTEVQTSPEGYGWQIAELVLVHDNGPDDSANVMRRLASENEFVRNVWLSKNFGQHSATLAGMASSGSEWIATLDEDGQFNPGDLGKLLDGAMQNNAPLVYGKSSNEAPHGAFRNWASKSAKRIVSALAGNPSAEDYRSFRLMVGEVGRSVAAYAGAGIYLDVALGWVASSVATVPVEYRGESDRESGYSLSRLVSHFRRLILSSGTRGLIVVSAMGGLFAISGIILAVLIVWQRILGEELPAGWTSQTVLLLITSGAILLALGIIADYVGVTVNAALGKPPYVITNDPGLGPLGRKQELPKK